MSEEIPDPNLPGLVVPSQDAGDNPPEPNTSDNTSTRAVRGSPAPLDSLNQVSDPIPDPFSPSGPSSSSHTLPPPSIPLPDPLPPAVSTPVVAAVSTNPSTHPSDPANQVDAQLLSQLNELGFEDTIAKIALVRTANTS
ncbi:hypothetical protein PFISCL1PPCAC_2020, partial [Pristionchus fissidentatus]